MFICVHTGFLLIPSGTWTATFEYLLNKKTTFNVEKNNKNM